MKKLLLLVLAVICFAPCTQIAAMEYSTTQNIPNNQIWYTSADGNVVTPNETYVFGATITSNTYSNGKGVITFDGNVTMIGEEAFEGCRSLTSITIPDSVTTIGENAFFGCWNLTSVTIPDSVTTIGAGVFGLCLSLTSVPIPDSVTTIGLAAFGGCNSLVQFNGKFAEDNGRILVVDGTLVAFAPAGLTRYIVPDSVTTIGDEAFSGCRSLTSVTIPNSVTTIGAGAFYGCNSLVQFNGKFAEDNGRILVVDGTLVAFAPAGLTRYIVPNSVTTIGEMAFWSCKSLISVTIPDSVTTIGENAFFGCSSLTSVTIPDSVTTIGAMAFWDCISLTSVTIPDNVTAIGDWAFLGCSSLTSVYCKTITPPVLGNNYVFDYNGSGRKVYVPDESVGAYKSDEGWKWFAIVGYDFENGVVVE